MDIAGVGACRAIRLSPPEDAQELGGLSIVSSSACMPGSGDRVALETSVAIAALVAKADVRLLSTVSDRTGGAGPLVER